MIFLRGELTIIICLVIFEGIASKIEKNWPNFFKFQSISILAIRSNRTIRNSFSSVR